MPPEHNLPRLEADRPDAGLEAANPFDILLGEIDAVLAEWRELVRLEPWTSLSQARLLDSLPQILPQIIRLAQTGAVQVDDDLKSQITDEHGYLRRQDAIPLLAVAEEWGYIKRAFVNHLRRRGVANGDVDRAMQRLETLVDDAVGYSLRGYYRPELDALRGRGLERRDGLVERRRNPDDRRRGRE